MTRAGEKKSGPAPAAQAAEVIASLLRTHAGLDLPVRLRAWDGSEAGPQGPQGPRGAPVAVIRSPQALRRLLWRPGELGLARAYIAGELDVEGDLTEGLRLVLGAIRRNSAPARATTAPPVRAARTAATLAAAVRAAVRAARQLKVLGPPPPPPDCELGLGERAEIRIQDYRDTGGGPYDAIASVEMGKHVGAANYPRFCAVLFRLVKPGGRLLIQQMSRGARAPGGGPFIESYITPDMTMRPVGETVRLIEDAGFEVIAVEAMRPHYVRTIRAWLGNFEANLAAIREILTEEQVRVWRLYLAGGALAFEEGRMDVDQILAVRPER